MDQTFPRAVRLPRRSDFLRAYAQGRRAHGKLVVIYVLASEPDAPAPAWRIGITASRKVGNSVVRNRVRRRVREYFRRNKPLLTPGFDYVVNLKPSAAASPSAALDADLQATLRRLGRSFTEPQPAVAPAAPAADPQEGRGAPPNPGAPHDPA